MAGASERTVLGNFASARFTHFGASRPFFRRDGQFFVKTDGPDGKLHEYPIAYTFGVYPLQQYLIAFPGGRYQALNVAGTRGRGPRAASAGSICTRSGECGATRCTGPGPYQNWNFMCADCHSTNVKKGYAAATDTYTTTWSELDVACEACHGPGSAHVAWARSGRGGQARADDATGAWPWC